MLGARFVRVSELMSIVVHHNLTKTPRFGTMDGQAVYDQEDRVIGAFEGCKQVVVSPTQNAFSKLNSANCH